MVIEDSFIHIFGQEVPYYGVLFLLGFLVAIVTAIPKAKHMKLPLLEVVCSSAFAAIGGILGAKLLSVLTSIQYIIQYHLSFADVIKNGFVFYGGLIGGVLGLVIYAKAFKLPLVPYFELYAAGTALGHAFGRIGCLLSGCCYGFPVSGGFYVMYRHVADPNTPLNVPLFPIQLVESLCLVAIFLICDLIFYRGKRRGGSALFYGICYPAVRFVLEFFRGDVLRGVYAGVSTSQIISAAILLVCGAIVARILVKKIKALSPPKGQPLPENRS